MMVAALAPAAKHLPASPRRRQPNATYNFQPHCLLSGPAMLLQTECARDHYT